MGGLRQDRAGHEALGRGGKICAATRIPAYGLCQGPNVGSDQYRSTTTRRDGDEHGSVGLRDDQRGRATSPRAE